PEQALALRSMEEHYPVLPSATTGVGAAIRAGRVELHAEIGPSWIDEVAVSPDHARRLRALNLRSQVIVPLVARGQVLGALSLGMAGSSRRLEVADLGLAE